MQAGLDADQAAPSRGGYTPHMNIPSASFELPREEDFPASGTIADKLRFALRYAVLAPSGHNTQPWHFVAQEDSVLVCADRTRALPMVDPHDRELIISCGAALFNLRVALAHFACPYQISIFPYSADPDVLAQVRVHDGGYQDAELAALFAAMQRRATNRNNFSYDAVPAALQQEMTSAAECEGAALTCISSEQDRGRIAALIAEADRLQFSDAHFRRELAAWVHPARSGDGMPAYAHGMGELLDRATPVMSAVIRTFDVGGGVAAMHQRLVQGSPLLACLATSTDDPAAWLAAGQALERMLLLVTDAWFDASYLNQPIEVPSLRAELQTLVGCDGLPQILLRVGSGQAPRRTPRRPLSAVLW